ncbi:hypothetical protein FB45DRAFT_892046, partial [Roridomyces roridus]
MTNGPPPSAAGPSRPSNASQSSSTPKYQQQPQTTQWAANWSTGYPSTSQQPTFRTAPVPVSQFSSTQQTSYTPIASYPNYRVRYADPYTAVQNSQTLPPPPVAVPAPVPAPAPPPPPSPSPSPPPPPKYRHWDRLLKDFMGKAGLKQALNGFEADILVMNPEFELKNVPEALIDLLRGIVAIQQGAEPELTRPLEERKLEYIHAPNPASPTSLTKSISAFLAQNRARSDASNRTEFLQTLAEKRKRINDDASRDNPDGVSDEITSCARTYAKSIDRDAQMKYDIAKNVDGPLQRTMRQKVVEPLPAEPTRPRTKSTAARELKKSAAAAVVDPPSELHLGVDQRIRDIETHFSVRYVPAPPDSLLARLQYLEEHIIRLEKDYPPWAALHFNQPNRGWPPPPRATPIIVPAQMRSAVASAAVPLPKGARTKNTGSSLQRAVMDQLAMKEARTDLAGGL